jgi:hypothetical protein
LLLLNLDGRATLEACIGNLESWEPSQHLLIDKGKPRKTCVEMANEWPMNADYLLGTEILQRLAQFLHIIQQHIQNYYSHVSSNIDVDILSYGHIILRKLPRCLYHIVLGNMSLVNLISGLLIRSKTLCLTSQMLSGVCFGSTNDIHKT